ncbi:BTAD domain-containing putative transcriptional regulator [Actinosynnema sp. NPDC050436]|uniref:AfsR/SARP family transcriptional regulator n=1 Tax=Actinosynnema sp. NPDC050436 TaxID=3155659 RepID=UPI0033DC4D54
MEFFLLGEVAARSSGGPVDLGPAMQRCVLAALAVDAGRVVPVGRVVERVWGVDAPAHARSTLSTYTSRLRAALPDARIVWRSGGYLLDVPPEDVDLHRFRALRRAGDVVTALGLWRGEPLTGLDSDWARAERELLRQERLSAELDLVDDRLRQGRGEGMVADLAGLVAAHPLDERLAGQYLLALHRAGRSADALEHFHRVRTHLRDHLGADPGEPLRSLHSRILNADPGLVPTAPVEPAPAAPPRAAPRQLPAAPGPFVGRPDELARLDEVDGTAVISSIAGVGGIGKTWLALHWAHRNAHRFPDGQLFVDLRGFGPEADRVDPSAAVRGFLEALGVDRDRVPVEPHAQTALFRTTVADRRVLLVVDNAADTGQVVPLLPGTRSCAVLVTSRNRLPGLVTRHGARPVPLDVLTEAESRALLVGRLGADRVAAEPEAVTELVARCGGFPLALGIIAGRAGSSPGASLASAAAELRDLGLAALDDGDPAASLPDVLRWSYLALPAEQAAVFALLGIAPGPTTDLRAATSLAGLPAGRVAAALRGLHHASLVDVDGAGRYRMHDMVREYAAQRAHEHLSADERGAALRRAVDFYLHTAHAGDVLLDPHRTPVRLEPAAPGVTPVPWADESAALAWFEAEHACLLAAQQVAADHGRHPAVWHLAWALSTFHKRTGRSADQLAAWQATLTAAEHLPDPTARIQAHRQLGREFSVTARHDDALHHLHAALELADRDPAQQAVTHWALAWAWEMRGGDHQALDHAGRALALHERMEDPIGLAIALNQVGWYEAKTGAPDRAREHCEAALALHRKHNNRDGEANTLDSLGFIHHHTGHHEEAATHYGEAINLYRELGDTYETASTLNRLAQTHLARGRPAEARAAWHEALTLYQSQHRTADADAVRRHLADHAG